MILHYCGVLNFWKEYLIFLLFIWIDREWCECRFFLFGFELNATVGVRFILNIYFCFTCECIEFICNVLIISFLSELICVTASVLLRLVKKECLNQYFGRCCCAIPFYLHFDPAYWCNVLEKRTVCITFSGMEMGRLNRNGAWELHRSYRQAMHSLSFTSIL